MRDKVATGGSAKQVYDATLALVESYARELHLISEFLKVRDEPSTVDSSQESTGYCTLLQLSARGEHDRNTSRFLRKKRVC